MKFFIAPGVVKQKNAEQHVKKDEASSHVFLKSAVREGGYYVQPLLSTIERIWQKISQWGSVERNKSKLTLLDK